MTLLLAIQTNDHTLMLWKNACSASGPSSPEDKGDNNPLNTNPMMQLFYGQYLAEGVNEGWFIIM